MSFENIDQPKNEDKPTEESTQNQSSFESNTDSEPKGESHEAPKYGADIDKLNKRLQDKDAFIEQLLSERKQDRSKFESYDEKLSTLEEQIKLFESSNDILEKLRNQGKEEETPTVEKTNDPKDEPKLDPNYLREQGFLTREDLQAEEARKKREANLREVSSKLAEKFGEKIDENVARLAQEADMTFDEAFELAGNKPKAFERLFLGTASKQEGSSKGFTTSVNTSSMQSEPETKRNYMKMSTDERIAYNMRRLEEMSKGQ